MSVEYMEDERFSSALELRAGRAFLRFDVAVHFTPHDPDVHGETVSYASTSGEQVTCAVERWDTDDYAEWKRDFFRVVHNGWNDKLWLVPTYGATRRPGHGNVITCQLATYETRAVARANMAARVMKLAEDAPGYRSNVGAMGDCVARFRRAARRAMPGVSTLLGAPMGTQAELTNRDVIGPPTWSQTVVLHEMGHMIGLDHVGCGTNELRCYGVGAHQQADRMGLGDAIRPWHATPWLTRLHRYASARRMAHLAGFRWTATTTRPPSAGRRTAAAILPRRASTRGSRFA